MRVVTLASLLARRGLVLEFLELVGELERFLVKQVLSTAKSMFETTVPGPGCYILHFVGLFERRAFVKERRCVDVECLARIVARMAPLPPAALMDRLSACRGVKTFPREHLRAILGYLHAVALRCTKESSDVESCVASSIEGHEYCVDVVVEKQVRWAVHKVFLAKARMKRGKYWVVAKRVPRKLAKADVLRVYIYRGACPGSSSPSSS